MAAYETRPRGGLPASETDAQRDGRVSIEFAQANLELMLPRLKGGK